MFRAYAANPSAERIGKVLKCGVSAIALGAMTAPAIAQVSTTAAAPATDTSDGSNTKEITITGIRASLANAQNIKRNSDTVVDAITASDIGALPDRSVTEALQRVPGVAMNRFAGSNDPRPLLGRRLGRRRPRPHLRPFRIQRTRQPSPPASAARRSASRTFPPSCWGSVEVYKNVTAEMIEGGLAGTVNLNTRKPFDSKGFHIAFDAEANYGDMEQRLSPTYSFLISDTWDTGIGRVGLLGSVSSSELRFKSNGLNVTNIQTRDGTAVLQADTKSTLTCRNPLPGTGDTTTLPAAGSACGAASTPGADGLLDNAGALYAPLGGQFREEDYDTKRRGVTFAAQVGKPRPPRPAHGPVPQHALRKCVGRTYVRERARPFGI